MSLWLQHDSDHLSCPVLGGNARGSSTLTFRLRKQGAKAEMERLLQGYPHWVRGWDPGTECQMGPEAAGVSVGIFVAIEMFLEVCRVFRSWHQPCPENHVVCFTMFLMPFYLPKEFSGSCLVLGLKFTDVL